MKKRLRKYVPRPNMSIYAAARKGKRAAHWKGGVIFIGGRKWLYKPGHLNAQYGNRYVVKSRYVMSEYLKRPLKSSEIVHHINGDKTDDRRLNLCIVTRAKHNTEHHSHPSKKTIQLKRIAAFKRKRNTKGQFI